MAPAICGGPGVQQFRILTEELDDDGFGRAGEIADHVLQELREFHVEHRFRLFDFGAHGGDHFLAAAFAVALEFDGNIAGIGFGHLGETQLEAGAAGGALHFGRLAQNFFHVGDDAIGLVERGAGGHDVVDDEAAFVHGGQEIAAGVGIAEVAAADQGEREDGQNQRVFESSAQGTFVDAHEAARPGGGVVCLFVDEVVAERRGPGQREGKRGEQGHAHRDRQCAEENAGNAGDGDQGQENHDGSDGGTHQGGANFTDRHCGWLRPATARDRGA